MFNGWTSREKMLLSVTIILLLAVASLLFSRWWDDHAHAPAGSLTFPAAFEQFEQEKVRLQGDSITTDGGTAPEQQAKDKTVVVDIKGAVQVPGVYSLTDQERVIDAIHEAGGLTDNASTLLLNLAQPLFDGMVIYVPTEEEVERGELPRLSPSGTGLEGNAAAKISINRATKEELQQLPGIGPTRAEAIIRYREENGHLWFCRRDYECVRDRSKNI
ncbi:helix-hairpin-helix domain-containing protein [Caldalkalibacillus thermarum TA2.A1]|uniref:Helix-hairpin-helix domain-containing protein n=1 Tax=Caldalkalibacillus thermarum (strain TA2.A1) TaxID=986075 RepID=A0A8X8L6V1_CALTT|nr:helix-hairpin-helix domain-containing protein [Caldalkalibacillus thermarum]QZT33412.1 helix-hairpin-helix domain-containing protein [Caldalkalibacillus thermarum TA2.A1]